VKNSYPAAEHDYRIQQSNFYINFPSNDGNRIKLFKQWQPNKKHSHTGNWMTATKWQYSNSGTWTTETK